MTIQYPVVREGARRSLAALLSALILLPAGPLPRLWAADSATVDAVEVGSDQVTIRLSAESKYNAFVTANPPRLVLQLLDTEYQAGAKALAGKGKFLKGVRAGQFQRTPSMVSRVVLDLNSMAEYHVAQDKNVLTVSLGAAAPAADPPAAAAADDTPATDDKADAPPATPPAAPAIKPKADAAKAKPAIGEGGGMTTKASPELTAVAMAADVSKTAPPEVAAEPAPAPAPEKQRGYKGDILSRMPRDPISLDFDNTDIRDIVKLLAAKAKVNIIYGPDIAGSLTLHLVDVPFNDAFRTALTMMNLTTTQVGDNILRIITPAALAKAQTAAATATRVIPLNYAKAADLIAPITSVRTAEGRTGVSIADPKTNSLIITESLEGLSSTERLVAQLDVRPKQVLIEVKLVEVNLNNSLHYGIQWDFTSVESSKIGGKQGNTYIGNSVGPASGAVGLAQPLDQTANTIPPGTNAGQGVGASGRGTGVNLPATTVFGAMTIGRITNNYFLSATLTAAAAEGKVKVLSDPKVATLNNQPANINVTTSIPYTTSNVASTGVQTQSVAYVVTGIQLQVTPTVNADGRITLLINPNVSQPSATAASSTSTGAPAVDSRNASTTVLVKDGETVVIGGLISDSVSNQIAKIPILGDIPILGWLFKKKDVVRTRTELLIFVTPKIMD